MDEEEDEEDEEEEAGSIEGAASAPAVDEVLKLLSDVRL